MFICLKKGETISSLLKSINTTHLKGSLKQLRMSVNKVVADQGRHLKVIVSWLISKKKIIGEGGGQGVAYRYPVERC